MLADARFATTALSSYYSASVPLCNLGVDDWTTEFWLTEAQDAVDLRSDRLDVAMFQLSFPTKHFGEAHRDELVSAPDVVVCLWANAVRIEIESGSDSVTGIEIATTTGKHHRAEARRYVLATGAIEAARLLLASNDVRPAGVGNGHDL